MIELAINNVSVEYTMRRTQEKVRALDGMNLSIGAGEFVTLLGPSGCGKTTLLNAIAGLVPITDGQIWLGGRPVAGPGRNRAMVFQSPALFPWRTVSSNVGYGLEIQGSRLDERSRLVKKYVELVGLGGFEQSYPYELSGGMQQRVNLARALATEPELLLLDEPLAALDPLLREFMASELERIWLQTRQTTLFVTHMVSEAIFLGDRVAVLSTRPGKVIEIVPVNFPRPRPTEVRHTAEFHALEDRIWRLLKEAVVAVE